MAYSWFLHIGSKVSGPFNTDEVNDKVNHGELPVTTLIWWRGQREWVPISFWQEKVQEILESVANQRKVAIWYVDFGSSQVGPITQVELVANLKAVADLAKVRVWSIGNENRKSPFEMHDLMEMIGIDRREYERTPLNGQVTIAHLHKNLREFSVKAASISAGGLGVVGKHDLRRGEEITLMLDSEDLGGKYHLQGEVMYVTEQGYTGIRIKKANAETLNVIKAYVDRFTPAVEKATLMKKSAA